VTGIRPSAAILVAFAAFVWAVSAAPARALPLYASREGTKCASCHFDPNGGGMRNEFGFSYDKNRHSMEEETKFGSLDVDPQLNQWIRFGADVRLMYLGVDVDNSSELDSYSFFPMQGNLRVALTPQEHLTVVASHGLYLDERPSPELDYTGRELYALVHGLPHDLFLQVGRFRVPFGLRQDDHTSFVRSPEFLPYDSQKEDAGIAFGSVGKNGWFEFSYTNGGAPSTTGQAETIAGKVAWAFPLVQGGISGYSDMGVFDQDRWSIYLTKTFRSLTLLGEYAGGTDEFAFRRINSMAAFAEADYRVSRGLNLRAKFDYLDSDREITNLSRRYLVDLDIEPMPFTQVKLSYRHYHPGTQLPTPDKDEYLAQLYVPF
jgi:hypothetical protein